MAVKLVKHILYLAIVLAVILEEFKVNGKKHGDHVFRKRSCARIGEVCDVSTDCCGNGEPETGHCVICTGLLNSLFGIGKRTCGCSQYSVAVDPETHQIVTDICDGRDKTGKNVCRVRVAPPDHVYYRGDEYYNQHRNRKH